MARVSWSQSSLVSAWNATGNHVYPTYFDALIKDWVRHLPCNGANATAEASARCKPLGAPAARPGPVCRWDDSSKACDTGTFESPWRSLEMGVRMADSWPRAFFAFQQALAFTTDGRVLMLLGVSEHFQGLLKDGGHPGEIIQTHSLLVTDMTVGPSLPRIHSPAPTCHAGHSVVVPSPPDGPLWGVARSGSDLGTLSLAL
jgi:hypothetical protein